MLKNLRHARKWSLIQRGIAVELTNTFPPTIIEEWTQMVEDWLQDHSMPDPYEEPEPCKCLRMLFIHVLTFLLVTTLAAIRLEISKEEAEDVSKGVPLLHKVSPAQFLRKGFEIEERQ